MTAFLAGLLLFAPSAAFIAAVQVIATANASTAATVAAVLIVIVLTVLMVWLPLTAYLAAPEATTRALRNANGWLVAHGRTVVDLRPRCRGRGPGGQRGARPAPRADGRRPSAVIYVTPAWRKTCHARPIYGTLVL